VTLTDTKKKLLISASVVFVILLIDQIIKIWIKTHFFLYHGIGTQNVIARQNQLTRELKLIKDRLEN